MTTECEPRTRYVHVPQLDGVVHGATDEEVTAVVVLHSPHSLWMLAEGDHTLSLDDVPHLHSAIATGSGEVLVAGVEAHA